MGKKKDEKVVIKPIGFANEGVTGSCNLITFGNTTIAVEMGGCQEKPTTLENYVINKRMIQDIKPQNLDYIFTLHNHYDHIGNICSAYATGRCNATIISPKGSTGILREMWEDSAKISEKECAKMSKKYVKQYDPLYTMEDVSYVLPYIKEFPVNEIIELTENLKFRYTPSGHIRGGQQLELFITQNNHVKKILITSDLGNTLTQEERVFVENFVPVPKANIVLGECTYGAKDRQMNKKDFEKDLEKIKSAVIQYCVDNNNRLMIPTFALDKTPVVIWYLYKLFGQDKNFKIPIVITSPLAIRLLNEYEKDLADDELEMFQDMMHWDNLKLITEPLDVSACIKDTRPKVIVCSGGMLQSGWSVSWAQSLLPRRNDCILFMGYCGENTLGWKIKHAKQHEMVTIGGAEVKNECQIIELKSFSSHMQRKELINYYKNIQADKIYLLHGGQQARRELKEDLVKEIANMSKTTKVSIVNKSTVITL